VVPEHLPLVGPFPHCRDDARRSGRLLTGSMSGPYRAAESGGVFFPPTRTGWSCSVAAPARSVKSADFLND
jgi:hypothetical protein